MRARRLLRWLPPTVLTVAALLLCLRCVHREQVASAPAQPASAAGKEEPPAPVPAQQEPVTTDEPPRAELEQAAEPQDPDEDGDDEDGGAEMNAVAQFMRFSDAHDRDLLASVERETKKSPSPEVMELLAMRRTGASRNELERFIDSELGNDVRVRMAAKRWLRASMGGEPPPASPQPGTTAGPRRVKALTPQ